MIERRQHSRTVIQCHVTFESADAHEKTVKQDGDSGLAYESVKTKGDGSASDETQEHLLQQHLQMGGSSVGPVQLTLQKVRNQN